MAQYKVPQDVEADDKLLGPFTFRQFVYLLIAAGLIALAVALFNLFPLLAIIPVPPVLLLLALALPLKKDQPMETYLAAIVSYYLKPRKRLWVAGQRESTIEITAPKIVEDRLTRDISGEEATHRLSFLADVVDSGGYSIKNGGIMRDDLAAEANATQDMFENNHFDVLNTVISKDETSRHEEVVNEMRAAIEKQNNVFGSPSGTAPTIFRKSEEKVISTPTTTSTQPAQVQPTAPLSPKAPTQSVTMTTAQPTMATAQPSQATIPNYLPEKDRALFSSSAVVVPGSKDQAEEPKEVSNRVEKPVKKIPPKPEPKRDIIDLANNKDFSVATIAKEANRIKNRKDNGEVFISLH